MDDFRVVLSGTEAIYVSKVELFTTSKFPQSLTLNVSQDLGFVNRAFHGFGFKMQVWPHDVEIRKNMVNLYTTHYTYPSPYSHMFIYTYTRNHL